MESSQIPSRSFLWTIFGPFANLSAVFLAKLPLPSKIMGAGILTTSVAEYLISYLAEVKEILSGRLYFKV